MQYAYSLTSRQATYILQAQAAVREALLRLQVAVEVARLATECPEGAHFIGIEDDHLIMEIPDG